jgi:AmmeMemoRadiSam system protein B
VIRPAAAAGRFYPRDPRALARAVDALLRPQPRPGLRALVAPHAGYAYSGPVAGRAFSFVPSAARVVLLGPSHFAPLEGMAVSSADAWETPLGIVPVSRDLRDAARHAGASVDDAPHAGDHALEVELPFLQRACPDGLEVLPVAVGRCPPDAVAALLAGLDALAVVSTDLSHYRDDADARALDRATADAVLARDARAIPDDGACGVDALRGLAEHARREGLRVELLELATSADTTGDPAHVVGYGAFAAYGEA